MALMTQSRDEKRAANLEAIHAKRRALQAAMPPFDPSTAHRPAAPQAPQGMRVSAEMVCPHCGTRGTVFTQKTAAKRGVSGGKATGAILTGGLSLFATGLSRKQVVTKAHCSKCSADWTF